jgi:hypothetical protein
VCMDPRLTTNSTAHNHNQLVAPSPRTTPIHVNAVIASLSPSLLVSVAWTLLRRTLFCAPLGVRPRGAGDRGRIDERRSVRRGGFHSPIVRLVLLLLLLRWLGWARWRGWVDDKDSAGSQMGAPPRSVEVIQNSIARAHRYCARK